MTEYYEIDCPVCDDGKKHKARIIRKMESEDRMIMEVECEDCRLLDEESGGSEA